MKDCMKGPVYAIENRIGGLFHSLLDGEAGRITEMFAEKSCLKQLDTGKSFSGQEEIRSFWEGQIRKSRDGGGEPLAVYLPCSIYLEERETGSYYSEWETYSFRREAAGQIQYFLTHMQAEFLLEKGTWKFKELFWNEILELVPWRFEEKNCHLPKRRMRWLAEYPDGLSLQDYMEIRNLQGHFTQEGMDRRPEWFSDASGVRLELPTLREQPLEGKTQIADFLKEMREKEIANGKNYLFLPVITAPVIYGNETSARGLWLVIAFQVRAQAFGISEPPYQISVSVGRFSQEFVKEEGHWRFLEFRHEVVYRLEEFCYNPEKMMRHRMREQDQWENTWLPGPEQTGIPCPGDVSAIEMMMPQWTGRLRKGNSMDFVDRYMVNSQEEISMLVAGSTQNRTSGYEKIRQRFGPREKTGRRENPVFHTLASPVIEFSEDARYAKAAWTDFSMADFSGAFQFPPEPVCYHMTVSKYYHEFVRDKGEWKLFSFGWEPGIFLGGFPFDEECCRGFYRGWEKQRNEFPMIGEPYLYD